MKKKKIKASDIGDFLGAKLFGDDLEIDKVCPIDRIGDNALSFAKHFKEEYAAVMNANPHSLVVCSEEYMDKIEASYIVSDNPRLDFLRVIDQFFAPKEEIRIEESALIHPDATLGKNISIGAHVVIGPEVVIGNFTRIGNNVVLKGKVRIGKNCVIKSNSVIGEEGFGFEYSEFGIPQHFPHIGSVEIGDNVYIGSCSTVERATIDKTWIADNVKIDDLVQVGHNSTIERNTMVMAGSIICGGAFIGQRCWIAPNSTIKEKVRIGENALIGLGSVVINDVPLKSVWAGNPAKEIKKR
ncbi:MAG: UDP-3-O-(3-hydroxymyristoyl)glucosamine N-acyltransferase [Acidobacteria bacterium]|nr:UDP-3-O-(3-hydroxymyristoyl)glucosamine N-acyltransferase [Acidobacteriota bacterium]